jgi:hypothetical protein
MALKETNKKELLPSRIRPRRSFYIGNAASELFENQRLGAEFQL